MDVINAAIWVSDMDVAREFFVEDIGLEEHWSFELDAIQNVYVGGSNAEIQLRYDPSRKIPTATRANLDHIALGVNDVDAEYQRLHTEADCAEVAPPRTVEEAGKRVGFLRGIDGYVIELVEDL